jgi:biopolymer transport protein ExbD
MMFRMFALLAVLALVLMVGAPAVAADDVVAEGKVVKVADGKLTIVDKDGKEHSCTVAKTAKITVDGKEAKVEDLKAGVAVKVTVEKKEAVKIEGKSK